MSKYNYEYTSESDPPISDEGEEKRLMKKYYDYVSIEKQAVKNSFLEITHSKRLQNWKHRLMLFSILQGAFIMAAILLGFL